MKTKILLLSTFLLLFGFTAKTQSLLIDDFEPTRELYWTPIGESVELNIVDNPLVAGINSSSKVLKISYKFSAANQYAGAILKNIDGLNVGNPNPAEDGNMRYAHVKFYKEISGGSAIKIQKENNDPADKAREIMTEIPIGQWVEIVFDFKVDPASNVDIENYKEVFIMANITGGLTEGQDVVVYIDDIKFNNDPNVSNGIPEPTDDIAVIDNFENGMVNFSSNNGEMGGMELSVVDNPNKSGVNVSNKVLSMKRIAGAANVRYAGMWAVLNEAFAPRCDMDKYSYAHYKLLQDVSGASANFKVESSKSGEPDIEVGPADDYVIKVGEWQDVVFDLTSAAGLYGTIVIMPDYLQEGDPLDPRPNHTLYVDDIMFTREKNATGINDVLAIVNSIHVTTQGNTAFIAFKLENTAPVAVTVYNVSGQMVNTQSLNGVSGTNQVAATIAESGVYFVQVKVGSKSLVSKFVK